MRGWGGPERREVRSPRRVCAGGSSELEHDCGFGGVTSRAALPEVFLSHPLADPFPGEFGVSVTLRGNGGVKS